MQKLNETKYNSRLRSNIRLRSRKGQDIFANDRENNIEVCMVPAMQTPLSLADCLAPLISTYKRPLLALPTTVLKFYGTSPINFCDSQRIANDNDSASNAQVILNNINKNILVKKNKMLKYYESRLVNDLSRYPDKQQSGDAFIRSANALEFGKLNII